MVNLARAYTHKLNLGYGVCPQISRLMLHAHTIAFRHPITHKSLQFTAPIPTDMQDVLSALRTSA